MTASSTASSTTATGSDAGAGRGRRPRRVAATTSASAARPVTAIGTTGGGPDAPRLPAVPDPAGPPSAGPPSSGPPGPTTPPTPTGVAEGPGLPAFWPGARLAAGFGEALGL